LQITILLAYTNSFCLGPGWGCGWNCVCLPRVVFFFVEYQLVKMGNIMMLMNGWGFWIFFYIYIENNNPNWRTHSFSGGWNHQPDDD
jgi:hypothetical protein